MYTTLLILSNENQIEDALVADNKLLDIYRHLNTSWIYRGYMEYLLFQHVYFCNTLRSWSELFS